MKKSALIVSVILLSMSAFAQTTTPETTAKTKETNTVSETARQTELSGQEKGQAVSTVARSKAETSQATAEEKPTAQKASKLDRATDKSSIKKSEAAVKESSATQPSKDNHGQSVKTVAQETESAAGKGQVISETAKDNPGTAKETSGTVKTRPSRTARASQGQTGKANAVRPAQVNRPSNR